jgi:hypothetical protein
MSGFGRLPLFSAPDLCDHIEPISAVRLMLALQRLQTLNNFIQIPSLDQIGSVGSLKGSYLNWDAKGFSSLPRC